MEVLQAERDLNGRLNKAIEIVKAGNVTCLRSGLFKVKSQRNGGCYVVDLFAETCNCPDFLKRGGPCKHIFASRIFDKTTEANEILVKAPQHVQALQTKKEHENWNHVVKIG